VFFQTLESTAPDRADSLKAAFSEGYKETFEGAADVIHREQEIGQRGRYL
jgi:N6-L-threonylcarbamoyladenine synthase/protein kinase Bud32